MKTWIAIPVLLLLAAGAFYYARTAPQQATQRPGALAALYLSLGENATSVERWDGSVNVSGGRLVSLEGRHFMRNDAITGANSWRCTNRRDEITGFPRITYNEMNPEEAPPPLFFPAGLYVTLEPSGDPQVSVNTAQGNFRFRLSETGFDPKPFLNGRVTVTRVPAVEKLTSEEYEDDEAAIAALPGGSIAVAWVAYRDRADRVLLRTLSNGVWTAPEEVTPKPADIFRCSLAVDSDGHLWTFWSEREGQRWHIFGRQRREGKWLPPLRLSGEGSNTFHRAAASHDGHVFVVWQSFRGAERRVQSDIYMKVYANGSWSDEMQVSTSPANDWEPAVAGGASGSAFIAWDSYDKGNYDIYFRPYENGRLGPVQPVTSSPRFQAHASVAVDPNNRPWLAWDESGVNWGKDHGYLITPPMAVPLHQERSVRVAMWDGKQWMEPKAAIPEFYVYRLFSNMENPHIAFDGQGTLTMVLRHWTRQNCYGIGSRLGWENFVTRFDGQRWTYPVPLAHSIGSIEKRPALVRAQNGAVWAAWMTDNRPLADPVPQNADIYAANLGASVRPASIQAGGLRPFEEPFAEALPIHPFETENVEAIRGYTIEAGDRRYKIYRGDMHRHTDISPDFKYDGSLIEVYRYALDAASLDYIAPTDHQIGYDQEFTWWQHEKLVDLFHLPGSFTPLFGYERSLPFPNGHRNVIFPQRGVRTLPIGEAERRGQQNTGPLLFPYLKKNNGISMPHSSGTPQGTDFRDNDPEVEPLIEIFQGYRASYEYQDAPLAASRQKQREQRSGFNPLGYWWNALAKGLKLGVQASSDHWSTHMSYACIVSERLSRESLFDAMKKRHAYAATDNIILDFQAEAGGRRYIMGDVIKSRTAPALKLRAIGTERIKQLVIVKNQKFIYVGHPNTREVSLEFTDRDFQPGANYYYMRVVQVDNNVAWSSPIWVE